MKREMVKTSGVTTAQDKTGKMIKESSSLTSGNKFHYSANGNSEITSNILEAIPAIKNVDDQELALDYNQQNIDPVESSRRMSKYRSYADTTELQNMVTSFSKPLQAADFKTLSSFKRQAMCLNRQKHEKELSPPLQNESQETQCRKTSSNTLCPDLSALLGHMSEELSFQQTNENVPDICPKPKCGTTVIRGNIRLRKGNKPQLQPRRNMALINVCANTERPTKDIPSRVSIRSESPSLSRKQILTPFSCEEKKQESFVGQNSKYPKQTVPIVNYNTQSELSGNSVEDISDLSSETMHSSMSSSCRLKTGEGKKNYIAKTSLNRPAIFHSQIHSPINSHRFSRNTRLNTGELPSQGKYSLKPGSSKSDMYVREARKVQTSSISLNRRKNTKSPTAEKKPESQSASLRKQKSGQSETNTKMNHETMSQSDTARDIKADEVLRSTDKARNDLVKNMQYTKLDNLAVLRQHRPSTRKLITSVRLNKCQKIAQIDRGTEDKIKTTVSKMSGEECKQSSYRAADIYNAPRHIKKLVPCKWQAAPAGPESCGEQEDRYTLKKSLDKARGAENGLVHSDLKNFQVSQNTSIKNTKEVNKRWVGGWRPAFLDSQSVGDRNDVSMNINTGKVKSLPVKVQTKDTEKVVTSNVESSLHGSYKASGTEKLCDMAQFDLNDGQDDLLPVICFSWRKRKDTSPKELSHEHTRHQLVVSLDQGLELFKQIMADSTSEKNLCNINFLFSQCSSVETEVPANDSGCASSEYKLSTYFQLTPVINTQSSQVTKLPEKTNNSQLKGILKTASKNFHNDNMHTDLPEPRNDTCGEPASSVLNDKIPRHKELQNATQMKETTVDRFRKSESSNRDTFCNTERTNLSSLWTSVAERVVAFFVSSRDKQSTEVGNAIAEILERTDIAKDQQINSSEKEKTVEDDVVEQEKPVASVSRSQDVYSVTNVQDILDELPVPGSSELLNSITASEQTVGAKTFSKDHISDQELEVITHSNHALSVENKEELNVHLQNSGRNLCAMENAEQASMMDEVKETQEKGQVFEPVKLVSEHGHVEENHSEQDTTDYVNSDDIFNKISTDKDTHVNTSHKQDVQSIDSHKDDMSRNKPSTIAICQDTSSCDRDNLVLAEDSAVLVSPISDDLRSCHDHQLIVATSSEYCPDPSFESPTKNMVSLTTKVTGCGPHFKQYPHLVWTWRCGMPLQGSEIPGTQSEPMNLKCENLLETRDGNVSTQMTGREEQDYSHEDSLGLAMSKNSFNEVSSYVKPYTPGGIHINLLSSDSYFNTEALKNTSQTVSHVVSERLPEILDSFNAALTPTRGLNEPETVHISTKSNQEQEYPKAAFERSPSRSQYMPISSTNLYSSYKPNEKLSSAEFSTIVFQENITATTLPFVATTLTEHMILKNDLTELVHGTNPQVGNTPDKLGIMIDSLIKSPQKLEISKRSQDEPGEEGHGVHLAFAEQESHIQNKADSVQPAEDQRSPCLPTGN